MKNKGSELIDIAYFKYVDSHTTPPSNPGGPLLSDNLCSVKPIEYSKEGFIEACKKDKTFSKKWDLHIEERKMTWEEQVQWVMRNTDVELENLYIVEEIAKGTTPTNLCIITHDNESTIEYSSLPL